LNKCKNCKFRIFDDGYSGMYSKHVCGISGNEVSLNYSCVGFQKKEIKKSK